MNGGIAAAGAPIAPAPPIAPPMATPDLNAVQPPAPVAPVVTPPAAPAVDTDKKLKDA